MSENKIVVKMPMRPKKKVRLSSLTALTEAGMTDEA